MRLSALCALLALTHLPVATAQNHRSPRLELSLQGAYYPHYLDGDQLTVRRLGIVAGLLVRPAGAKLGFELGGSMVQQRQTTSSEAPHIRTVRALGILETPLSTNSRLRVFYGAGLSLLRIDAQVIDCGDFSVCNEWSHGDLTTIAPTAALGLKQPLVGSLVLQAAGRLYVGLSRWGSGDLPVLGELALGLSVGLP